MIHGAYVIMVVEHISNKEKVILLGAILQGAAQVITHPNGFNIIPEKGAAGAASQLWLQSCDASHVCVQRNTVRAITLYLQNRDTLQQIGQETLPGGSLFGAEIRVLVDAESKIKIERAPVKKSPLPLQQSLQA